MWSDRLLLAPGGTFIYAQSLMDGETRERYIGGKYGITSDGKLTLSREVTLRWTGGKTVPATGSIGTKTEIVGARMTETRHEPPVITVMRVQHPIYDEEYPHPWSVVFSGGDFLWGGRWWKYETEEDARDLRGEYAAALRSARDGSIPKEYYEGTLHEEEWRHEGRGSTMKFWYVTLDAAQYAKLAGELGGVEDVCDQGDKTEIQIFSGDESLQDVLRASIGHRIAFQAKYFFEASTIYHRRNIVMEVETVEAR
jgi:hypothetical protein